LTESTGGTGTVRTLWDGVVSMPGSAPAATTTGTLIMGGFYGYVDDYMSDGWNIFWAVTDANEVYLNRMKRTDSGSALTYQYGTSTLLTTLEISYDITALASKMKVTPSLGFKYVFEEEDYGGTVTSDGIIKIGLSTKL
jgi:hypothetical protein